MEEIFIDIAKDGKVTIEAEGFEGTSCEDATRHLETALGMAGHRELKPEYDQEQEHLVVKQ